MKMLLTVDRIRSVISGVRTEKDLENILRTHKIKYHYSTDTGYTAIKIPARSGYIRIYRACSRSAPFIVRADSGRIRPVIPVNY